MCIYTILKSIDHNPHYLNRYYNFIIECQKANEGKELSYTERHHILPKSLFPEYENFSNKWNICILTARQHFICHWILWKAYNGPMTSAFHFMLHIKSDNDSYKRINSKVYQIFKEEYSEKISGLMKGNTYTLDMVFAKHKITGEKITVTKEEFANNDELVGNSAGTTYTLSTLLAKDPLTNESLGSIPKDDPRWETGEIVHILKGRVHTQEAKDNMRAGNKRRSRAGKNNSFFGRKHTEETKKKLADRPVKDGADNYNAKRIQINGIIYSTVFEGMTKFNITRSALTNILRGRSKAGPKYGIWEAIYLPPTQSIETSSL